MLALVQETLRDSDALSKKKIIVAQLYSDRKEVEPTWKQLSDFINPYRGRFDYDDPKEEGRRRDHKILDDYAMHAHSRCAAGLHAGLTSKSRPWFELSLEDTEKAKMHEAKIWLDDVRDIMMSIYAKSNAYQMFMQIDAELAEFGTAAAMIFQDYYTAIRCRPYTCGEYAGMVDARGRLAKLARKMKMTAYQMVSEFGYDACSSSVRNAYDNRLVSKYFNVCLLIEENLKYQKDKIAVGNFPWRAYYWEESESTQFLKVSGFNERPFIMPRWQVVGNGVYGIGPGHTVIGNVMQLQKLEKLDLRCLDNLANPALQVPNGVGKVNRIPGSQTTVPAGQIGQIQPLFATTGSRTDINQKAEAKHEIIKEGFYVDLFMMLGMQQDSPQMTAREIAERHEEKLWQLSPVLEQLHNEMLSPTTSRVFEICQRNGLLPPMPDEIKSDQIKVEFVSLLAQAQKMIGIPAIQGTVAFAGNLAGIAPEIMDNLNLDAALREHAAMNGAPETILRDEDEVAEIRKQRAAAQAQQQQMEQAAQAAPALKQSVEAAKLLSETPVGDNSNIVGDLLGRTGGI